MTKLFDISRHFLRRLWQTPLLLGWLVLGLLWRSGQRAGWGYLYLRARSVLPGTLWHAANGNLGYILMSV